MGRWIIISTTLLIGLAMPACETILIQDGIQISGRTHDVSASDIRAAIAADIAKRPELRNEKPFEIDVIGPNKFHLYWRDGHDIMNRVRGRWQYDTTIVVLS